MKQLFSFYFKFIMPTIGRLVSKDSRAYTYLPESVDAFPERENLIKILEGLGYKNCSYRTLSGGISCMYLVEK
jgi:demethylmenaquinone methyltransferase/2-methoxy-6-polyprenyl-1,4-benzoquinol methylase